MASMLFSGDGAKTLNGNTDKITHTHNAIHPLKTLNLDAKAIKATYEIERAKREGAAGVSQFKQPKGANSQLRQDVFQPTVSRDSVEAETGVLICGAGFAGLITAVSLKKDHGIEDFTIIDRAGDFGGTWYWNQYPGKRIPRQCLWRQ